LTTLLGLFDDLLQIRHPVGALATGLCGDLKRALGRDQLENKRSAVGLFRVVSLYARANNHVDHVQRSDLLVVPVVGQTALGEDKPPLLPCLDLSANLEEITRSDDGGAGNLLLKKDTMFQHQRKVYLLQDWTRACR